MPNRFQSARVGFPGRAVAFALALLAGAFGAWGQTQERPPAPGGQAALSASQAAPGPAPDPAPPSDSEIRVRSNLVATPVTVTDSQGEFVYDLSKDDFQIFDNGQPQQIQSLTLAERPLAVVILIQANDAVKPLLKQLQPLAPLFSDLLLGPNGRAAVMVYADRVQEAQDFSNSGDQLASTLKNLRESGEQQRLNDAMARAIALLARQPETERRILIVFSDGFDSGSDTSEQDVIERAGRADVSVYGLGFSPTEALLKRRPQPAAPSPLDTNLARQFPPNTMHTPTTAENAYGTPIEGLPILDAAGKLLRSHRGQTALEAYTAYTGGTFNGHWSERALQDELSRISNELHSQYELAYVPNDLGQTGFHHIVVRVEQPGVRVRTRAGYFYPWVKP